MADCRDCLCFNVCQFASNTIGMNLSCPEYKPKSLYMKMPLANLFRTDLSESYRKLEEKASTIYNLSGYTLDNIIEMLAKGFEFTPSKADVVEVVRCQDCLHCTAYRLNADVMSEMYLCDLEIDECKENFYCAYAERKQNERTID